MFFKLRWLSDFVKGNLVCFVKVLSLFNVVVGNMGICNKIIFIKCFCFIWDFLFLDYYVVNKIVKSKKNNRLREIVW